MANIECIRCHKTAGAIERSTYPGKLGEEIQEKICATCWTEWQAAEVMVINELKLNFMDPRSQEILVKHMREFLCFDGPPTQPIPGPPAE